MLVAVEVLVLGGAFVVVEKLLEMMAVDMASMLA